MIKKLTPPRAGPLPGGPFVQMPAPYLKANPHDNASQMWNSWATWPPYRYPLALALFAHKADRALDKYALTRAVESSLNLNDSVIANSIHLATEDLDAS